MSKACWQAAIEVLEETDNPAVMWGDSRLLHLISSRLGWKADSWVTEQRVMAALNRSPGKLRKAKTTVGSGRVVSIFRLPLPK
jgi:hypothetical protein